MPYLADVKCTNCEYSGSLEIPEGIRVSEMICPECQTKSLIRTPKETIEPTKETPA